MNRCSRIAPQKRRDPKDYCTGGELIFIRRAKRKVTAMHLASLRNRMLFAACAVFALAGSTSGLRAEDADDTSSKTIDQRIIDGILSGIGLQRDRPAIEYRERSPLVVPPGRDLPPPETTATVNNPAWPVDAGDKRRKESLRDRQRKNFDSAIDDGRVLTREELDRGRQVTRRGPDGSRQTEDVDQTMLKPNEMGKGILNWGMFRSRNETAVFTGEPPRTTLTEPPAGYRTPSSAQPYGLGQQAAPPPLTEEQRRSKYGTNE
jgi:hypothetical protein